VRAYWITFVLMGRLLMLNPTLLGVLVVCGGRGRGRAGYGCGSLVAFVVAYVIVMAQIVLVVMGVVVVVVVQAIVMDVVVIVVVVVVVWWPSLSTGLLVAVSGLALPPPDLPQTSHHAFCMRAIVNSPSLRCCCCHSQLTAISVRHPVAENEQRLLLRIDLAEEAEDQHRILHCTDTQAGQVWQLATCNAICLQRHSTNI